MFLSIWVTRKDKQVPVIKAVPLIKQLNIYNIINSKSVIWNLKLNSLLLLRQYGIMQVQGSIERVAGLCITSSRFRNSDFERNFSRLKVVYDQGRKHKCAKIAGCVQF